MTEAAHTWDGLQHSPMTIAAPAFAAAVLVALLGVYAWRRRSLPGALPFACMMLLAFPWLLTDIVEVMATGAATKIFCFRLEPPLEIALFTAELAFAVQYGFPRRQITGRTVMLLAIVPAVALALTLTNPAHHFLWVDLDVRRSVHPVRGTGLWVLVTYAGVLSFLTASVFVAVFIRDRRQRRPIVLCLCGMIVVRFIWFVEMTDTIHAGPLGHSTGRSEIAAAFSFTMYAIALFRYRMLDLLSIARETVIEQIREAVVVLDLDGVILDVNPAAEAMFGLPAAQLIGRDATCILPTGSGLDRIVTGAERAEIELSGRDAHPARQYAIEVTPLPTARNLSSGRVLVLRDVTEERRAQEVLVGQQRALAASEERDRVARELHDSVGQVLGYVKVQVQAARDALVKGRTAEADRHLARLASVAQDAHADVRDYIVAARTGITREVGLVAAVDRYLRHCAEQYGMNAELVVEPTLDPDRLDPAEAVQLLRIVQEGLTNARKHAKARGVRVTLGIADGCARASVEDDGIGFDPAQLKGTRDLAFGIPFMRERAESVGGSVRIDSAPGAGTRVVVSMPLHGGLS